MRIPTRLYRYRPLTTELLERELRAISDSYLFAPEFKEMNDPMEAFYETGGQVDEVIHSILPSLKEPTKKIYRQMGEMIDKFALVSFATTNEHLAMWAYYASNFNGICLEFDTNQLAVGDFQNEELRPVIYARRALPPLTMTEVSGGRINEAIIQRLTCKRSEWAHESEWRFITGVRGPKHYLDSALSRVFLGPSMSRENEEKILELLKNRPVEVLKGKIKGFDLTFQLVKEAQPFEECERIGAGTFRLGDLDHAKADLLNFLAVPFEALSELCGKIAMNPNMEDFAGVDISSSEPKAIFIWTTYKMRDGTIRYCKRYFDKKLREIFGRK
jgi:Protein of unknown function (DUF2971)